MVNRNYAIGTSREWSEWVTPIENKDNVTFESAIAYLPTDKSIGDLYTCTLEIEFDGVTVGSGGPFRFLTQGKVDGQWGYTIISIWRNVISNMTTPPQNGVYRYTSTVAISEETVNRNSFGLGFRADYWGSGRYRYRMIKVEKGAVATNYIMAPEDGLDLAFTVSSYIISAKAGYDVVTVTFESNVPYQKFECRATKEGAVYGPGIGVLVASFSYTPAETSRTFEIYDDYLTAGDGNYRISLYAETGYGNLFIPVGAERFITKDGYTFLHKGDG